MQKTSTGLKKIDSLQVFRAIAALSVVMHHAVPSVDHFVGGTPSWLDTICNFGFLGVDFFFVLSGFIIMSSHISDDKSFAAFKVYGIKRFARIYPPYLPISIALLLGYALFPSLSAGTRANISLISSLLLLPDSGSPALAVAWTLIHEVMFYMIFCVFFISNRLFLALVVLWILSIATAGVFFDRTGLVPFFQRFLDPVNLEFIMGMGVAVIARRVNQRAAIPLICAGILIFALLVFAGFGDYFRFPYGIAFSVLVLGVVVIELRKKLVFPKWAVFLGDASYAIYLIHDPLSGLTSRAVARMGAAAHWGIGVAVGVSLSIAIGTVYHLYFEKPIARFFRKLLRESDASFVSAPQMPR